MVVTQAFRQAEAAFGGHPLPDVHIACAADHVPARVLGIPFEKDMRRLFECAPVAERADDARSGDEQAAVAIARLRAAGRARGAIFLHRRDEIGAVGDRQPALVVEHPVIGGEQIGQRGGIAAFEHRPEQPRIVCRDRRVERGAGRHRRGLRSRGGRRRGLGLRRGRQRGGEEEGEGHGRGSLLCCLCNTVARGGVQAAFPRSALWRSDGAGAEGAPRSGPSVSPCGLPPPHGFATGRIGLRHREDRAGLAACVPGESRGPWRRGASGGAGRSGPRLSPGSAGTAPAGLASGRGCPYLCG